MIKAKLRELYDMWDLIYVMSLYPTLDLHIFYYFSDQSMVDSWDLVNRIKAGLRWSCEKVG